MDISGRRRSTEFEDRGEGSAGGGGGFGVHTLFTLVQFLGVKGTLVVGAIAAAGYFVLPSGIKQQLFGGGAEGRGAPGSGSVCQASPEYGKACDFSRVVLASTEDVWSAEFRRGAMPTYRQPTGAYQNPKLAVFSRGVQTGCGNASSAMGPFYCPRDRKLYVDPSFYETMERRLEAPGDFAQAYVIAHEVGHHVQNLIGSTNVKLRGETDNQTSVRVELQADCLAGVWGHTARASLAVTEEDLGEAVKAAHAIGDDTLGHSNAGGYTHGTSEQRKRWFRRGFEGGDARKCDTFGVTKYEEL